MGSHREREPVLLGDRREHAPGHPNLLGGIGVERQAPDRSGGHRGTRSGRHRVHRHHQLLRGDRPVHARGRPSERKRREVRPELRPVLLPLHPVAGHDLRDGFDARVPREPPLRGRRGPMQRSRVLRRLGGRGRRFLGHGKRRPSQPADLPQGDGVHAEGGHRPGSADRYLRAETQLPQGRRNSPDRTRRKLQPAVASVGTHVFGLRSRGQTHDRTPEDISEPRSDQGERVELHQHAQHENGERRHGHETR
mmetsp:Transcript_7461/g.18321  ORF Transcript_7461/g.18321 Transcript_7461/m.18321 type:complete len:251 (+) Transcript_7461:607-1359(+)